MQNQQQPRIHVSPPPNNYRDTIINGARSSHDTAYVTAQHQMHAATIRNNHYVPVQGTAFEGSRRIEGTGSRVRLEGQPRFYEMHAQNGGNVIHGETVRREGAIHREAHAERIVEKPPPQSRIEYIPYQYNYTDYETQQVLTSMWVPVQRKATNYYTIEHITEYIPRQVEEYRVEVVPEERIHYRTQYVPVERKIVHYPKSDDEINGKEIVHVGQVERYGGDQVYVGVEGQQQQQQVGSRVSRAEELNIPGYQPFESAGRSSLNYSRRTNYVTADNYTPAYISQSRNRVSYKTEENRRETRFTDNTYLNQDSPSKRLQEY